MTKKYRVSTSIHIYEENDPSYECKIYSTGDSYEACIELEYQRKCLTILNCTPRFLLRDSMNGLCDEALNVTKSDMDNLNNTMINNVLNNEKSEKYPQPCISIRYKPKLQYVSSRSDENLVSNLMT